MHGNIHAQYNVNLFFCPLGTNSFTKWPITFEYQSAKLDSNNNNKLVLKTFVLFFIVCLQSCQADLVKDNGHKYFLSVLADAYMRVSHIQLHPYTVCIYRPRF